MAYAPRRMQFLGQSNGNAPSNLSVPATSSTPNAPLVQYVRDYYVYGINALNFAAGATFIGNIQIDASSDFELTKMTVTANLTGADTLLTSDQFYVTMLMVDSGSGRNLFSIPIALRGLMGDGRLPYILPVPRRFPARTNIALTFANYSQALTYDLRVAFHGAKIFAQGTMQ
jgi:hypothetical protein